MNKVVEKINDDLEKVWANMGKAGVLVPYVPVYFDELDGCQNECAENGGCCIEENSRKVSVIHDEQSQEIAKKILFVGLNPSFSERYWASIGVNPDVLSWPLGPWVSRNKIIALDSIAHGGHPFFEPHREISRRAKKVVWKHVDLFPYRVTKSSQVKNIFFGKGNTLNGYGHALFDLLIRYIIEYDPDLIIFVNALASDVYKDMKGKAITYCHGDGAFHEGINGKDTPVILSGMITGQRALDKYSRERLYWHVSHFA